jgi:hypothetical protein
MVLPPREHMEILPTLAVAVRLHVCRMHAVVGWNPGSVNVRTMRRLGAGAPPRFSFWARHAHAAQLDRRSRWDRGHPAWSPDPPGRVKGVEAAFGRTGSVCLLAGPSDGDFDDDVALGIGELFHFIDD